MTFHASAIPFRRQRIGWEYRTTRDGVEHRFGVHVVLYPDGEIIAAAFPLVDGPDLPSTFTFRATATRRADANGKVHFVLNWLGNEVASRARLTDLLELSGNQSIALARTALDEQYIKARAAQVALAAAVEPECPGCVEKREKWGGCGPSHEPSRMCRSGKRPHCTCNACY